MNIVEFIHPLWSPGLTIGQKKPSKDYHLAHAAASRTLSETQGLLAPAGLEYWRESQLSIGTVCLFSSSETVKNEVTHYNNSINPVSLPSPLMVMTPCTPVLCDLSPTCDRIASVFAYPRHPWTPRKCISRNSHLSIALGRLISQPRTNGRMLCGPLSPTPLARQRPLYSLEPALFFSRP